MTLDLEQTDGEPTAHVITWHDPVLGWAWRPEEDERCRKEWENPPNLVEDHEET